MMISTARQIHSTIVVKTTQMKLKKPQLEQLERVTDPHEVQALR
jgi:hypothetical protein